MKVGEIKKVEDKQESFDVETVVLEKIAEQLNAIMLCNKSKIFAGFRQSGDDIFPLSLSVKLSGSADVMSSEVSLSFTLEKIKDMSNQTICLRQETMF